ncbi:MAG TPA: NADH-quinone oxidoreductase subunit C [Vicinamibacterales bacterium]|nr:NADH-quinone oxidoreductase subunit C [Vicinamibacterales bacterium]
MDPVVTDALRNAGLSDAVEPASSTDMETLYVDRDRLLDVARVLRDDPTVQFVFLADVTAVDLLPAEPRFEVVYHLACLGDAYRAPGVTAAAPPRRLRLKVRVPGADARVASVTTIWPTAGWPEREVFDLFGLAFDHHPDLRRILMPEDWEGSPLRKDYPVQIRKDTQSWSPIQLSPEEFAENIRAQRERADRAARDDRG